MTPIIKPLAPKSRLEIGSGGNTIPNPIQIDENREKNNEQGGLLHDEFTLTSLQNRYPALGNDKSCGSVVETSASQATHRQQRTSPCLLAGKSAFPFGGRAAERTSATEDFYLLDRAGLGRGQAASSHAPIWRAANSGMKHAP